MIDEKNEPSVWHVAGIAICVFVGIILVTGLFSGAEVVAIAAE